MNDIADACVIHNKTGEVIHDFTKMEIFCGRQYLHAWCVGHYLRIVKEEEHPDIDYNTFEAVSDKVSITITVE